MNGDRLSLSRLLTQVEKRFHDGRAALIELFPHTEGASYWCDGHLRAQANLYSGQSTGTSLSKKINALPF
ncbi:MAG: hypothetical protein U0Z26_01870 [Anaerolineales bacterium]